MRLSECEVAHRHVRGINAIFIFGARALSADECAALAAEYAESYGPGLAPGYCSPDGWQQLGPQQHGPLASRFEFDEAAEVISIDGVRVSAEFVGQFIKPSSPGRWFRVDAGDHGQPVISARDETAFDAPAVAAADKTPDGSEDAAIPATKTKRAKA